MFWERFHPLLLAAIIAGGVAYLGAPIPPKDAYASMMAAAAGASAILVGFLSAAKAVLLSVSGSPAYKALKASGYSSDLFRYIRSAIEWSIGFAILCIVLMFIDPTVAHKITVATIDIINPFMLAWAFVGSVTVLAFLRVSRIIFKILNQI